MEVMNVSQKLTITQAAQAFGVSTMTLHLWRKGTVTKEALPHDIKMIGNRRAVRISAARAEAWAKRNGVTFSPERITGIAKVGKSGPIPKTVKASVKVKEPPSKRKRTAH
jgi:hypothetical protein